MKISFNLLDDPWIVCVLKCNGSVEAMGLSAVLARAPEIREIVDESPIVIAGLHRLLLAILHRNFGPRNSDTWGALWEQGRWEVDSLGRYFSDWRACFDLFGDERPFYQDAGLDFQYAIPIAKRAREIASYTTVTLFDHTLDDAGEGVSPAQAARFLVGHQAFTVGGLVSLEQGQDPKLFKSADAGPLNRGAVGLVKGSTLFETLMLNLHQYSREDAEPFEWHGEDRPAWERAGPPRGEDRVPTGYLDLLTWQSRRIRLRPEWGPHGELRVRQVVIMKGDQFPDSWHRRGRETMLAFTKREKAPKGQDPWPAVSFREDRALWRESLALFQSVAEQQARPRLVDWVADLVSEGVLPRRRVLAVDYCGLATNKASVHFWRHERLTVPLAYLDKGNEDLLERLREALTLVERAATALGDAGCLLARLLLAPTSDDPTGREPSPDVIRAYRDRLALGRAYWSKLEVPFRRLVGELASDESTEDGEVVYGRRTLPDWASTVRDAAGRAFREATAGLDSSARSLKALACGERRLAHRLDEELGSIRGTGERRST